MVERMSLAAAHLQLRQQAVLRALQLQVDLQAERNTSLTSTAIPESTARSHLQMLTGPRQPSSLELTPQESTVEEELRRQARERGCLLPLDDVRHNVGLDKFEIDVLLWCVAAETHRSYQTLFAYVQDDWNATLPTIGFLAAGSSLEETLRRRAKLAPHGLLRRVRLIEPHGTANSELRQQVRLGNGVFDSLCGRTAACGTRFRDPASVTVPAEICVPDAFPAESLARYAGAMRAGMLRVFAIWGVLSSFREDVVFQLATCAKVPLRRLSPADWNQPTPDAVVAALDLACALDAIFWLDLDRWNEVAPLESSADWLASVLSATSTRVILTGSRPWRPLLLLESSSYAECELPRLPAFERRKAWAKLMPTATPDLSERFPLSSSELRSVARVTATQVLLAPKKSLPESVRQACAIVTRKHSAHFATFITPRRGPDSLILHPDLHRQVLEIADFFLIGAQVYETWGFESRITGAAGVRALFSGEPGTGKTLAAEVIAYRVGLPLMKADLARMVSKWVGDTEKSLDVLFTEAEQSHAVLFLDECDALTGKRGEIRHGSDKFANLETAYLLQRLDQYAGLAILATNLREQMDDAFQRRFQAVLHFPLPAAPERLRIWRLAFPPEAPLAPEVRVEALATLELTGASIVSTACTAALLAANAKAPTITMEHIMEGVSRQFQRESKMFDRQLRASLETAQR